MIDVGKNLKDKFIFEIETTTDDESFTITCQEVGSFDCTIGWGDGSFSNVTSYNDSNLAHTYGKAGTYTIVVDGSFPNICYVYNEEDSKKIKRVINLGNVGWKTLVFAFIGCNNMTEFNAGYCDTNDVINMAYMFSGCSSLTNLNVKNFDTNKVTDMSGMFSGCESLIELDLSNFDTSNVTDMSGMFFECRKLSTLNMSNFVKNRGVEDLWMFHKCHALT